MLLTDVYFFFSVLGLAILLSIAAFYWKQLWWLGLTGGFFWIMLGLWGIGSADNPVISNQRYLAVVFMVIGIGIFWLPFYINSRENKSIVESFDELDEYNQEMTDHQRQLNKLRKATRRNYRGEE